MLVIEGEGWWPQFNGYDGLKLAMIVSCFRGILASRTLTKTIFLLGVPKILEPELNCIYGFCCRELGD